MNIAFLAPGFLQRMGGGITYLSHANYLILTHDRKTEQPTKQRTDTNSKRTHATGVGFEFVVSSLLIPIKYSIPGAYGKTKQQNTQKKPQMNADRLHRLIAKVLIFVLINIHEIEHG